MISFVRMGKKMCESVIKKGDFVRMKYSYRTKR